MNVLENILEEIGEKFKTADAEKFDCEELCDVEDWYDSGYIDGQLSAHEKCMDIIRSHMGDGKGTNVLSNNGWIPVEERLPEEMTDVLCCFEDGTVQTLWQNWENSGLGGYLDDNLNPIKVIAWQPLPEPYKPDEN